MGLSAAHRPGRHWGVFGSGFRRGAWERGVRPSGVPVGERWGEIRIVPSRPSVVPSCFPMLFPLQGTPFQASKFTIPSRRHARAHFFGGPDSGGLRTLPPWGGKSAPSKSSDSLNPLLLSRDPARKISRRVRVRAHSWDPAQPLLRTPPASYLVQPKNNLRTWFVPKTSSSFHIAFPFLHHLLFSTRPRPVSCFTSTAAFAMKRTTKPWRWRGRCRRVACGVIKTSLLFFLEAKQDVFCVGKHMKPIYVPLA